MGNHKEMKNILITGGTGFIGSNICSSLVKQNYKLTIFDNNFRGKLKRLDKIKKNIKFIKGDIRNKKSLEKSFKNIDTVIHLAFINGTQHFYDRPIDVMEVGIKGIFNVLELSSKYRVKNFFLASSSEVYQTPNKIPTTENEMLKIPNIYNPRYSYGAGKIISELLSVYYAKKNFDRLVIFRPHNVYSHDMGNEHVIPQFIKKIISSKKNQVIKIKGSGNEVRSFIHINDFVKAFNLIFKKGKNLEIYNIGTTEKISIKKVAMLIAKKIGKKIILKKTNEFFGNTSIRCPDIKKIKKLGFKQSIKLNRGLEMVLESIEIY
jgi:nucleoside-diphosphate-sugar epimerase